MKACLSRAKMKVRSLYQDELEGARSSRSSLYSRHAKCLKPKEDNAMICNKAAVETTPNQRRKETEPFAKSSFTKLRPFAQIRALPLCLSQLRSESEDLPKDGESKMQRSSYIVNAKNTTILVKRARSLSPEILNKGAFLEPLKSPMLVRSSSFPKKASRKRFVGTFIPVRGTATSMAREAMAGSRVGERSLLSTWTRRRPHPNSSAWRDAGGNPADKFPGGLANHQEKLSPQHPDDDELGGIIPSSNGRKAQRSFGSQLLGPGSGGGRHHQSTVSANGGHPRARRVMKMDSVHSPAPPARMITTKSVHPPVYSQAIHRKPLSPDYPLHNYHYKSPSVSSSIYSEPIYRPSYKQGFLPQRASFGRSHQPPPSTMFDDDPGIMSEAETSSTGFRRGGKARSSLPVVRTPSKTLERPLGLVFLQYRTETKRALLPNEITSFDTVKALFVRSFPRQLTMEYLDAMNAKIYIHDGSKDMFYELEDLRDIRDRSVLRLFEPNINGNGGTPSWDQDQSYFSEPEFDSEYQHQHIHKTKGSKTPPYLTYGYAIGATNSLPRSSRPFSPAPVSIKSSGSPAPPKPQRNYSPLTQRPLPVPTDSALYSPRTTGAQDGRGAFPIPPTSNYIAPDLRRNIYSNADPTYVASVASPERRYIEDPYYTGFPPARSGSITPVIIDEEARFRMEHMERQLANLTGLVQKALVHPPGTHPTPPRHAHSSTLPRSVLPTGATPLPVPSQNAYNRDYIPTRDYRDDIDKQSSSSSASLPDDPVRPSAENHIPSNVVTHTKAPKFGKEKSVSFSDDPPEHGKQHSPSQFSAEKPTKPAIKSTTLPRMSQDRVLKAVPATATGVPKPVTILPVQAVHAIPTHPYDRQYYGPTRGELGISPETYNQLRNLQRKAKELKGDIRVLRRNVQAQALGMRETIKDTFLRFKVAAMAGNDEWMQGDPEKSRIHREKEYYKQEMLKLDKDLEELEVTVEDLRGHVITKRTRVNMSDVENMALVLSKASKSVADLKTRFPSLQESVKTLLTNEMDQMVTEEQFLKEEPERLETALRRCKKLTGTLVTLKRLASVQEQRVPVPDGECPSPGPGATPATTQPSPMANNRGSVPIAGYGITTERVMGAPITYGTGTAVGPGPENALDDLLNELNGVHHVKQHLKPPANCNFKRLPSYPSTDLEGSPVRSPLRPQLPPKPTKIPPPPPPRTSSKSPLVSPSIESSGGDSSESGNSQDAGSNRISHRHQELLRKQKQLQEQYNRLQMIQQRSISSAGSTSSSDKLELKKTGSESNLRAKLGFSAAPTGSLTNINQPILYETDIL